MISFVSDIAFVIHNAYSLGVRNARRPKLWQPQN
jgi:hypothetical protein